MLRSALAAAFSAALAIGALSGLTGAKGDAAQDSTWRTTSVSAAGSGDSTWIVAASATPGDSTWIVAASATPGDSTWVAPTDSTWVAES